MAAETECNRNGNAANCDGNANWPPFGHLASSASSANSANSVSCSVQFSSVQFSSVQFSSVRVQFGSVRRQQQETNQSRAYFRISCLTAAGTRNYVMMNNSNNNYYNNNNSSRSSSMRSKADKVAMQSADSISGGGLCFGQE
ncbi:hypothetical protein AWZ03_013131 [Drosophila navojoa]|uniref:Uncharacterized protein n=1 Tax=Drosophila navojoa TaxID=7232 RepID=A0A484AY04_DRONA|nr:hypothetical protein AWZ03_013131 [Drosophila navojoa]